MRVWARALVAGLLVAGSVEVEAKDLPGGWIEHPGGPGTVCARGEPYAFFVNPGSSANVIVDFIGGGACWDAESCAAESALFTDSVDALRDLAVGGLGGVYDRTNPENPYRSWTHVVVPYCTGDIHWGDADMTYTAADGTAIPIHHRGARNARSVLDWVTSAYPAPEKVFVTGCSAGAYGAAYWTPALKEAYPRALIREMGDSGAGIQTATFAATTFAKWNITANAPAWIPALDPAQNDWSRLTLAEFYLRAAAFYPDVTFAQYNSSDDAVQTFFYERMGGDPTAWKPAMLASLDAISAAPNFRSFVAPSEQHCATVDASFYDVTAAGVPFKRWLDALANDAEPPASVR